METKNNWISFRVQSVQFPGKALNKREKAMFRDKRETIISVIPVLSILTAVPLSLFLEYSLLLKNVSHERIVSLKKEKRT